MRNKMRGTDRQPKYIITDACNFLEALRLQLTVVVNRPSKISSFAPIASVQKLCGYFYPRMMWGKPQLSGTIPGGGRHTPSQLSKMTYFIKMTSD